MKMYDGFFILPADATTEQRKSQLQALENLIQKFNGRVAQKNELGRRPIGYMLKKSREGFMVTLDFEMDPSSQPGFRQALELHEDLLKFMITVKEQKETAPANAAASKPAVAAAAPQTRSYNRRPAAATSAPKA